MQRRTGLHHPLFIGALLLYAAYQLNKRWLHYPLPELLTSYLSDVLAMPVLLSLALAVYRRIMPQSARFVLPDAWLLASWLGVTVWFELLLSRFSEYATGDPLDGVAYGLGTLVFRRWLNRA